MATNRPKKIILHCSDTPDYPLDKPLPYDYGAADIDAWHRQRKFREIGYHAVIKRDGTIEYGSREESEQGAHVKGHNDGSLGICYIGTKDPTLFQIRSLVRLFFEFQQRYGISWASWHGHYEYNDGKECPGVNMHLVREMLRQAAIAESSRF